EQGAFSLKQYPIPLLRIACRPTHVNLLRLASRAPRENGEVGEVEDGRPAVTLVREQEATARHERSLGPGRFHRHRERDARESRVPVRLGGERRECWVGIVNRMAETANKVETGAVAPGCRHREPPGRDDDLRRADLGTALEPDTPGGLVRMGRCPRAPHWAGLGLEA